MSESFKWWYDNKLKKLKRTNQSTPSAENKALFDLFSEKKQDLKDWSGSIIDVCSYRDPEKALKASAEWHEAMANLGDGKFYNPIDKENVIYHFEDEWTLQKVTSQNDYEVEGNLMKHCIASYHSNDAVILSLRDQHNIPHVTLEMDKDMIVIKQSSGKCNATPQKKYFDRIKKWYSDFCMLTNNKAKILSSPELAYNYAVFFKEEYAELAKQKKVKTEKLKAKQADSKLSKKAAKKVVKKAAKKAKKSSLPMETKISDKEETKSILLKYFDANPGHRMEQASAAIGKPSKDLAVCMKELLKDCLLTKVGNRRMTEYTIAKKKPKTESKKIASSKKSNVRASA